MGVISLLTIPPNVMEVDVLVFVSSGNEDESVFTSVDDSDSVGIVEDDDIDVALFTAYQS